MMRRMERQRARELKVESMEREEGERLVGTTESLKSSGGEGKSDRAKMRRGRRVGEREGVTAWPRAPDTGCHLEINQQPGCGPTNQKLLLHLHNSCPSPPENLIIWKSLSHLFFISVSFVILSMSLLSFYIDFYILSVISLTPHITDHSRMHTYTLTGRNARMCDHLVFVMM